MNTPILDFLKAKSRRFDGDNTDKYYQYPITITDHENRVVEAFIQDAVITVEKENFNLDMIVIAQYEEKEQALSISKNCIAPEGCMIDWDTLHCAYEINARDTEPKFKMDENF